jgi:hypothetical protein
MAENKKSFLIYCDIIHTVKHLTDEEKGKLFQHLLDYVNDKNPILDDRLLNAVFEPIKQQLKRDLIKYDNICNRNSKNGSLGGRPKKPKKPSGLIGNPSKPKKADTDTDTDTDIDKDKDNVSKEDFTPTKFLSWFNKKRTELLEKPSNSNYLSAHDRTHLEILTSRYEGKDFGKALHNLCNDKWANESNQIIPKHFLKPENFDKYLQIETKTLITKKQKIHRGWAV